MYWYVYMYKQKFWFPVFDKLSCFNSYFIFFFSAKIQSMKYSIPKGDKKKKKEVTLEIAKLEEELNEKHKKELESSENVSTVSNVCFLLQVG